MSTAHMAQTNYVKVAFTFQPTYSSKDVFELITIFSFYKLYLNTLDK